MKKISIVSVFSLFISLAGPTPVFSFEDSIREQVIQSEEFLNFKRDRFARLRSSTTDNPYIQCLRDEHARIPVPRPSFGQYYSVRHPEYTFRESQYIINTTEACIEHAYESERCDLHHDQSIICDGNVFSRIGQVNSDEDAVSTSREIKDAVDSALDQMIINDAVNSAIQQ